MVEQYGTHNSSNEPKCDFCGKRPFGLELHDWKTGKVICRICSHCMKKAFTKSLKGNKK